MELNFWIVDTFSDTPFSGNPASVFLVDNFENEEYMKNIAMEINTPETVFIKKLESGDFDLCVYTPSSRGMFLGNSLFAAAKTIHMKQLSSNDSFRFFVDDRIIYVHVSNENSIQIKMQTPELQRVPLPVELSNFLSGEIIVSVAESGNSIITEVRSPKKISNLSPNIDVLRQIKYDMVIITADSHYEKDVPYDICTRVFAPKLGVIEDFVTPLAHAKLASYWQTRLEKNEIICFQDSKRPGSSTTIIDADYVTLHGNSSQVISGTLILP